MFGAFLGYNPIGELLPPSVLAHLSAANWATLLGKEFFPALISSPFMLGLHTVFYLSAGICAIAALASLLRGQQTPITPGQATRPSQAELPADAPLNATTAASATSSAPPTPTGANVRPWQRPSAHPRQSRWRAHG